LGSSQGEKKGAEKEECSKTVAIVTGRRSWFGWEPHHHLGLRRDKLVLIGFEIGFDWVCFGFAGWRIYCYNPLLDRGLSSFLVFSKIGFELGLIGFELGLFWPRLKAVSFS
jgi:hypothetical protein